MLRPSLQELVRSRRYNGSSAEISSSRDESGECNAQGNCANRQGRDMMALPSPWELRRTSRLKHAPEASSEDFRSPNRPKYTIYKPISPGYYIEPVSCEPKGTESGVCDTRSFNEVLRSPHKKRRSHCPLDCWLKTLPLSHHVKSLVESITRSHLSQGMQRELAASLYETLQC